MTYILTWLSLCLLEPVFQESLSTRLTLRLKPNIEVKVISVNVLDLSTIELDKSISDKNGVISFGFNLSNSQFIYLESEGVYYECFISPGDDLKVNLIKSLSVNTGHYSGKGSDINNYLFEFQVVKEKFFNSGKGDFLEYNINDFSIRLDSMILLFSESHKELCTKYRLSEIEENLLKKRYESNVLLVKLTYYDYLKAKNVSEADIPNYLINSLIETPFEISLLEAGMSEYVKVLKMYLNLFIYSKVKTRYREKFADDSIGNFPLYAQKFIEEGQYPVEFRSYMHAYNFYHWINIQGITPQIGNLYQLLSEQTFSTEFRRTLKNTYAKWDVISKGKVAPNILGYTTSGEQISLSEYYGKVVYIDVWATWCGPCIAEFGKVKSLINTYNNSKDIVFLFVSIDKNIERWKKFVSENPDLKGVHINQRGGDTNIRSIEESYIVNSIPRYILIDRSGKIAEYDAPPPSSEYLVSLLTNILK